MGHRSRFGGQAAKAALALSTVLLAFLASSTPLTDVGAPRAAAAGGYQATARPHVVVRFAPREPGGEPLPAPASIYRAPGAPQPEIQRPLPPRGRLVTAPVGAGRTATFIDPYYHPYSVARVEPDGRVRVDCSAEDHEHAPGEACDGAAAQQR